MLLLIGLTIWGSGLQGLVRPLRVTESSMVPFLRGQHAVVRCPACLRQFATELFDPLATDLRANCPRCGSLHELTLPIHVSRGDRVLVQSRWYPSVSQLRWRAVAARHPLRRDEWLVKRVVGLPGESIQLRDGDVLVNGQRQAKTLDEFRALAIPVCDTRETTEAGREAAWSRWQSASRPSAWRAEPIGGGYVSDPGATDDWSWLEFRAADLPGRRPPEMLLLDDDAFNQSLSRRLHPVRDLLLRCELIDFRHGEFACHARIDEETLQVVWDRAAEWVELRMDGRAPLRSRDVPSSTTALPKVLCELAVCDGRVHFALDGRSVLTAQLPGAMTRSGASVERLSIGARHARVTLGQVELLRDIYYLAPLSSPGDVPNATTRPVVLGPDELFVLGDNSPVSADSRDFGPVRRADLLGTLVRWPQSGR